MEIESSSDEFEMQDSSEDEGEEGEEPVVDLSKKRKRDANKPFNQVKHTFDINLTSLH